MEEFEEGTELDYSTILVFGAEWCSSCREAMPVIKKFEEDYPKHLHICHVDVDKFPKFAETFNVDELPAVVSIVGTEVRDRWSKEELSLTEFLRSQTYIRCEDYYTRSDVEQRVRTVGGSMKDFDEFMYGQGAPVIEWEDEPYCYWAGDVQRYLRIADQKFKDKYGYAKEDEHLFKENSND